MSSVKLAQWAVKFAKRSPSGAGFATFSLIDKYLFVPVKTRPVIESPRKKKTKLQKLVKYLRLLKKNIVVYKNYF